MRRRKNDDSDYGGEGTTGNEDDSGFDDEPTKKRVKEIQEKSLSLFAKSLKRSVWGTFMMASFGLIIYWGHAYVCLLVFVLQTCIFKELVGVRKKLAAERKLPLFRSIQWAWFFTAAFFTWSDGMFNFMRDHPPVTSEVDAVFSLFLEKTPLISLGLYSALLIVSILSLRKGMYRYQITQYTWTLVTCCIVVFQMRAVFTSIYSGLFWFVLPCSLVICNDIAAYFAGVCFKGKLTNRPLLELSPNKTWEGFLGAAIFTLFFAFFFAGLLSKFPSLVCAPDVISLGAVPLTCTPDRLYQATSLSSAVEDPMFMTSFIRKCLSVCIAYLPFLGGVEVCAAQFHAVALGMFASFVAPFGGFLASAIKRAYGIKDFAALIPGHGGMMDRFDCQFVMAMCTYVHVITFVQVRSPWTVELLFSAAMRLNLKDRAALLRRLQATV